MMPTGDDNIPCFGRPCPSCGSNNQHLESRGIRWYVRCDICKYRGPVKWKWKTAITAWQNHKIRPMHPATYKAGYYLTIAMHLLCLLYPLIPIAIAIITNPWWCLGLLLWPFIPKAAECLADYNKNVSRHRKNKWKEGTEE